MYNKKELRKSKKKKDQKRKGKGLYVSADIDTL